MADLIHFAVVSKGLEIKEKIKLILFAAGARPNTYIVLKIGPDSLEEKYEFEKILKENNIIFKANRAKSYEEIRQIKNNKILWELKGTWIGYDLFKDKKNEKVFEKYVDLLVKFKHNKADKIAGKLYNYPSCCIKQFIKEQFPDYLEKKFTYYNFYKKIHDHERKFPWVFHRPHAIDCEPSQRINKIHEKIIKEKAPKIWEEFNKKKVHKTELIVSEMSDIIVDGVSIWPEKDGYEYVLITKKPFEDKYYLVSFLTKKFYETGQILEGEVAWRHGYADVTIKKEKKKIIEGLHHERKLPLLGRKF